MEGRTGESIRGLSGHRFGQGRCSKRLARYDPVVAIGMTPPSATSSSTGSSAVSGESRVLTCALSAAGGAAFVAPSIAATLSVLTLLRWMGAGIIAPAIIPESPLFKPPATNPGGKSGMIKAANCGFANQVSHSQNRESPSRFARIAHESALRRHGLAQPGTMRVRLVIERE